MEPVRPRRLRVLRRHTHWFVLPGDLGIRRARCVVRQHARMDDPGQGPGALDDRRHLHARVPAFAWLAQSRCSAWRRRLDRIGADDRAQSLGSRVAARLGTADLSRHRSRGRRRPGQTRVVAQGGVPGRGDVAIELRRSALRILLHPHRRHPIRVHARGPGTLSPSRRGKARTQARRSWPHHDYRCGRHGHLHVAGGDDRARYERAEAVQAFEAFQELPVHDSVAGEGDDQSRGRAACGKGGWLLRRVGARPGTHGARGASAQGRVGAGVLLRLGGRGYVADLRSRLTVAAVPRQEPARVRVVSRTQSVQMSGSHAVGHRGCPWARCVHSSGERTA